MRLEEAENSVNEEVAPQVAESEPQQEQADLQDRNWREMRRKQAELEQGIKERDEFIRNTFVAQQQQQMVKEPEEPEEPDDEYINKGRVKRVAQKSIEPLKKEIDDLKKELANKRKQDRFNSLKNKFPDFDEVVNAETIALFEQKDPELAEQLAKNTDPYEIGLQSYKYIKYSGILEEVPGKRRRKEVEEKIEKNSKSVPSPQAYDKRPMAQAFKMSRAEQTQILNEMMECANQASFVPGL